MIKLSDFVVDFFEKHNVRQWFCVVGGGSMHLNDSFGKNKRMRTVYNHHEQASSISAEGYYRLNNKIAGLCVTSGPGAINALNGVAGAYQDSIPMIVLSGQCKTSLLTSSTGLNLRTFGNQEFDIISAVGKMTKLAVTITNPNDILYYLEKSLYLALNGRPGPCWIEIPVDIQAAKIDIKRLRHFDQTVFEKHNKYIDKYIDKKIDELIVKFSKSKRPVLYAGNGLSISGSRELFLRFISKFHIPVVTCWNSIDEIDTKNKYYVGRGGIMGDRAGNFAVQNSDLLLCIGTRLNIYQVGYQKESWARESFVAYVDIDKEELKKPNIHAELKIQCDAKIFLEKLYIKLLKSHFVCNEWWITKCNNWKYKYPVVTKKHYLDSKPLNVYALMDMMSRKIDSKIPTVAANGSASVVGSASYFIKKNQRFIINCSLSSMGYDLPASIGVCCANKKKKVLCIAGDGSIMMNLQELQTIVTNKLPIMIVLINNSGYQQMRITQTNLFNKNYCGIGANNSELSFPDFGKVAKAFGIPYKRCDDIKKLNQSLSWLFSKKSYCMLEVECTINQFFEPKSSAKILPNGKIVSPPLEDLAPFLNRKEFKSNMIIKLVGEDHGKT